MVSRIALGGSSVSKRMVAFFVVLLAAAVLAAVAGYIANNSHSTIATSGAAQSSGTLSDTPTRTLHAGRQTMAGPSSAGSTSAAVSHLPRRFGGVQP